MSSSSSSQSSSNSSGDEQRAHQFSQLVSQFYKISNDVGPPESPPRLRRLTKKPCIHRDREAGARLYEDYFVPNPVCTDSMFWRCFRVRRPMLLRIVNTVLSDPYFQQRSDALGGSGFTLLQKCIIVIRQLANGGAANQYDEYMRIEETTSSECLSKFFRVIVQLFGPKYLRRPTFTNCQRLLALHKEKHRFLGMLESLYCMHWSWKNCPVKWQ
ncbi:uncharacterized protein LOC131025795 [Salvia miltiorrhiza]|uniref:uncharacterized protein LOC131025795 n=1 Tax=Salvia miltiorrhiza TaxID=226208 RepID=UPI0025AD98C7|nr:uncharacterized protein LOC131025795 [Salvia miltiorrhiza]